ncbi:hypothetical protein AB7783_04305 [Tardiphaga sp. 172_B4_N1_3]|uniref:hypothetical protein n=1 Tax=Tardiphaga sp. 172_B4_N1_3 TaxID=3240787 RepID=UPI003F8B566B
MDYALRANPPYRLFAGFEFALIFDRIASHAATQDNPQLARNGPTGGTKKNVRDEGQRKNTSVVIVDRTQVTCIHGPRPVQSATIVGIKLISKTMRTMTGILMGSPRWEFALLHK